MKCAITGCPGEYEDKLVVHTVRNRGEIIVIDNVPAEVCSVCGDVLLKPQTIRKIEEIVKARKTPSGSVPLYTVCPRLKMAVKIIQ